jgi:hypothetical protein
VLREGVAAVDRFFDLIVDAQRARDRSPDRRVVVDHENARVHARIVT